MKKEIKSKEEILKIIRQERKRQEINQKELANYTGLSNYGISKIERGDSDVKISTLLKMAELLGLRINIEWDEE